jgi:hypothetical protein
MSRIVAVALCCLASAVHAATIKTTPLSCEGLVHAVAGERTLSSPIRGGTAEIPLAEATPWRITLESGNCWAAPLTAPSGDAVLKVWPKRTISGEFSSAAPSLRAHLGSPDGAADGIPASDETCRVEGKRWTCDAPRAALDIRLDVGGFAPAYFWNVETDDLGPVELHPGASIAGFVTRDDHGALKDAVVDLATEDGVIAHTNANARGFFQFTSVPARMYAIAARRPNGAPTHQRDIRVQAQRETLLRRPLLLAGFAKLRVTMRPAATPAGHPWTVALFRLDLARHAHLPLARSSATAAGIWERGELERETYHFEVVDEAGAIYFERDLEMTSDLAELEVVLSTIPVEGKIRMGNAPLYAAVRFEASDVNVMMVSDADGAFYGSLPHEGKYELRIYLGNERARQLRRSVEVKRESSDGPALVTIDLPSGRVKGVVVDSAGKPRIATVTAARGRSFDIGTAFTGEDGTFEIAGLEPGEITLHAWLKENWSPPHTVQVADDPQPVTIVLNDPRLIRGRVLSSDGGGIAGALISYFDDPLLKKTTTGPDGQFSFPLSSDADSVDLFIVTPGFPVKLSKLRVPGPGESADIVVSSRGGYLSVSIALPPAWPWIAHDGVFAMLPSLFAPRTALGPPPELRGDRFMIQVEPGEYAVCSQRKIDQQCIRRVVAAGGETYVDLRTP